VKHADSLLYTNFDSERKKESKFWFFSGVWSQIDAELFLIFFPTLHNSFFCVCVVLTIILHSKEEESHHLLSFFQMQEIVIVDSDKASIRLQFFSEILKLWHMPFLQTFFNSFHRNCFRF